MKKQSNGHRWRTEELAALIEMWSNNVPFAEMAEALRVTESAIRKMSIKLRSSGVPLAYRKAGHKPNRYNKAWSHAEVEFVIRRRREGASSEMIASEIGRSFFGVQGIVQKLRKEGVGVPMLGNGVRRLWDANALKALCESPEIREKVPK